MLLSTNPQLFVKILNWSLVIYTASLTIVLLYVSLFYTLPFAAGGSFFLKCTAWHIFFSVIWNWAFAVCRTSEYRPSQFCEDFIPHREKYCDYCQHWIPKRCHHCSLCEKCILKRDHHCFFTGLCIGFYNQRYFVVFCFYVALGTGLGFAYLMIYLNNNFKVFWSGDNYHYLLPLTSIEWLLGWGDISGFHLFLLLAAWWSLATTVTAVLYFFQQMYLIVRGQTTFEYSRDIHAFRSSWRQHLRSVFGPLWFLNFVFPMVCFKQEGNGVEWETYFKSL